MNTKKFETLNWTDFKWPTESARTDYQKPIIVNAVALFIALLLTTLDKILCFLGKRNKDPVTVVL